jgi:NAD(P)-dependent dehydrogenase (short-subunit alcohol dehydrogenase family)
MTGPFDLAGRHVLITGASSGLGRHFAGTLARAGARLSLGARRADALAETVTRVASEGGEAHAVVMDVTDAASVERALDAAESRFGPVAVLVNNAGVTATKPALDLDEADWDAVLDTNLKGVWLVAQATGRRMVRHGAGGSIVNIASILGLRTIGQVAPYNASNAGLIHLTRVLAMEWARHQIRVNAICPGYIETEMNSDFWSTPGGQRLIERIPQRRIGKPEHLDGALLLLASEAGAFMTGAVLTVDGGHTVNSL